jgi:hypothetical protein
MFRTILAKWGVLLAGGAILGMGLGGCILNLVRDWTVLNMVN